MAGDELPARAAVSTWFVRDRTVRAQAAIVQVRQKLSRESKIDLMARRWVFPILRIAALWALVVFAFCPMLAAQKFLKLPTIDVFAGYSYLRFDSKPLGFSDQLNLNGWNFELIPHIYQGLGVVADVSAHYGREMTSYNFLIGPQYAVDVKDFQIFGHGLFGRSRDRVGLTGSSLLEPSNVARNIAFGGGVDRALTNRLSWRIAQGDYMITSNFGGTQHNVRLSTGLVITFGKH